ncbi:MAG: carbohydrate kinase family protein [Candidatus Lokiarchaeota archaeon]|nr:carbohydrate kinase family protein [Candidatus Lokiarchaeota archaeon]
MKERKKILVVGECHIDLYYKTKFFNQLIERISDKIFGLYEINKIKSKNFLKERVLETILDSHKKNEGISFLNRGGNGNNSAELMVKLGLPIKLLTIIGKDASWILDELGNMGIDIENVYQIDKPTPISTIIEDSSITKILVAPNLKREMNFDKIELNERVLTGNKIIFFTPIAKKFKKPIQLSKNKNIISIFTLELQQVKSIEELREILNYKMDIMFSNLRDLAEILGKSLINVEDEIGIENLIDVIDEIMKKFSHIRIYTHGRKGSFIRSKHDIKIKIPIMPVKVLDQTGAGDTYSAGFISKLYNLIEDLNHLKSLYQPENRKELFEVLENCGKFGTYTAAFKISKGESPDEEELDEFLKS